MTTLGLAALAWVLLHLLGAGPLRTPLVNRIGENAFRGLFSLASLASLGWLVYAWRCAPAVDLFPGQPIWARGLMPLACVLLVCATSLRNPTLVAGEIALRGRLPVEGVTRVTRHPMLWAFSLWGFSHALAGGRLAGLLLGGSILVTALWGMVNIDRKRARALGADWDDFARATSRLPFAAILAGRQRFVFSEIGWARVGLGLALFGVLVWLHPHYAGVPAWAP